MLAIEAASLAKRYGEVEAVSDVSLRVERGVVYGYLGPNGEGKTTTIRMLTTLVAPTSGEARVLGYDVRRQGNELRSRVGVVIQGESYEFSKTVSEALDLYGMLWGVPGPTRRSKAGELLEMFGLAPHKDKLVQELSLGLRRRLQVAREFIHDAELLFLDEPTVGLDPIARRATLKMIRERVGRGLTVFLTTQQLDEAESLCDRVAVIFKGRLISEGTPQALKDTYGGFKLVEVSVSAGDPDLLASRLQKVIGVSAATSEGDGRVKVWTTDPGESFNSIMKAGDELGLSLGSVTLQEPSLEQAFINLIQDHGARG